MSDKPRRSPGRPSRRVERDGTARVDLAFWLADWRSSHGGRPVQDDISRATAFSRTAVRSRLYGERFAEYSLVEAILSPTNPSPDQENEWKQLYAELHNAHIRQERGELDVQLPEPPTWVKDDVSDTDEVPFVEDEIEAGHELNRIEKSGSSKRRFITAKSGVDNDTAVVPERPTGGRPNVRRNLLILSAPVLATVAIVVGLVFGQANLFDTGRDQVANRDASSTRAGIAGPATRIITVQNKVAIGKSGLIEDKTPAYLSTAARPFCADEVNNCKVPSSSMDSGAAAVVDCVTSTDVIMVNYDLKDPAGATNLDSARSRLWYHGTRNGQMGYISEVYVVERDRGGLGLPTCAP